MIASFWHRVLFAASFGMFAYCAYALMDGWLFQARAGGELERKLASGHAVPRLPLASGELLGRIEIVRLGMSVMIVEGTTGSTLTRAAGHIAGTGFPGQPHSNVGLAAHRDGFFRPLAGIRLGDVILVTTLQGEFRYRVTNTAIVDPENVSVLNPAGGETLTLVTCYPFQFVGLAPNRFIVSAVRIP